MLCSAVQCTRHMLLTCWLWLSSLLVLCVLGARNPTRITLTHDVSLCKCTARPTPLLSLGVGHQSPTLKDACERGSRKMAGEADEEQVKHIIHAARQVYASKGREDHLDITIRRKCAEFVLQKGSIGADGVCSMAQAQTGAPQLAAIWGLGGWGHCGVCSRCLQV